MKMPVDGITAVLFDWDFTLAYTLQPEMSHIERTAVLFQHVGIHYPVGDFRAARESLLADIALGRIDGTVKPQTRREIMNFYRQMLIRLGHPDTSRELAYRIYIAYGHLPTTLYDDVVFTLQKLCQTDLVLGILSNHSTTVRPVMEKVASITARHIQAYQASGGRTVESLTLVGGTSAFPGMAEVVQRYTGLPTSVPDWPMFVTPLGIALSNQRNEGMD